MKDKRIDIYNKEHKYKQKKKIYIKDKKVKKKKETGRIYILYIYVIYDHIYILFIYV